jgi:hypothetical protein
VWLSDLPPPNDSLRQGDLVRNVPFLDMSGQPVIEDGELRLAAKLRPGIVVTQCCDVEQKGVARFARVSKVKYRPGRDREAIEATQPAEPDDEGFVRYSTRYLAMRPVGGLLEPVDDRRLWVAMLLETVEYRGDLAWLMSERVARMTPEGRRVLRTKLMLSVGRVEDDDADYFASRGERAHLLRESDVTAAT